MSQPDDGHRWTDEELEKLEKRLATVYAKARDELTDTVTEYFASFAARDAAQRALVGTIVNGREYTEQDYKQWRLAQMGRGQRFEALRDRVAERMTRANETAAAYVNDATPGLYALNRNYAAYTIETQVGANVGFDLWDERTVRRLIVEQPDLMPYYPPGRAVKRGIDLAWGKRQITAQVTQGILQGESVKHLADRLQTSIPAMNRDSAIRAARTAVTGAQNAGRMDSYAAAERMGVQLQKEWLATLDNRTRHAHAMLDGQRRRRDEPFEAEGEKIMFPGDPSAVGWMVYNCRCTLIAAVEGVETRGQRRARDPVTGESVLIEDMTYAQWAGWKEAENKTAWDAFLKKGKNYSADQKQFEEYRSILGRSMPKSFAEFQDLKYNNTEGWERLKAFRRYKGRVPDASEKDFQRYLDIKEAGVIGTIRVPPEKIDASALTFRDEHAARHGCTVEEARGYVESAYCSIARKRWDGFSVNYYSASGAAYVDKETMEIKTSFSRKDYDPNTKAIVEVFE